VAVLDFTLNGKRVRSENVPAQMTLLDFLRARGLTGAKEGCAEGECGACAVALVEDDAGRSCYRVVNSCLMFVPMAAGREVLTVEALAVDGELSEAQSALASGGGSQCGYCTPGFVVSLFAEQYRPGREGSCDPMALAGNLCRCTGYRPIRDAARALGPAPDDEFRKRLSEPAPVLEAFATPHFTRPATLDACVAALGADPHAKLIAGATDAAVESNLLGRRWPHLISLEAIEELRVFSNTSERVIVGAALPLSEIDRRWTDAPAAFREWIALFASPLIRNRATIGGNLATASPIGDAAPLLLALDAKVHIAGSSGPRTIPLSSFFAGYRKTAMTADELIVSVEVPKPLPQFIRFYKVAKRRIDDISTVAAAFALDLDMRNHVTRARFAFGGVAATPMRIEAAEAAACDWAWNDAAVERVQDVLERTLHPLSDHRGSKEYRLEVSKSLVEKFRWECAQ
jgi:xanthine dehydrogenase small subunit